MPKEILNDYLNGLSKTASHGDAREESYYDSLKELLLGMAEFVGKSRIDITVLPKKTEGGNPDFRVWDGKSKIVGYIESKVPGTDLDAVEKSEQLTRYRDTFPNLLLTDFLEFRFYRNGELVDVVNIARKHTFLKIKAKPVVENETDFKNILDRFFSFTFPKNLNARRLAKELAKRTRFLKDQIIIEELKESEGDKRNYLLGFYEAFKKYLIIGLKDKDFADLYSQTITYGLFAARTRCEGEFTRKIAVDYIPQSIGILHDVFEFISLGTPPKHLQCIIEDITEVLASVNVGGILDEFFKEGKGDDPIMHFYETFLNEYDPKIREKRGVYYTPEPVVSFIVRSIDSILKLHFERKDGLADNNVKLLDPAAGTMTFITEAAKLALRSFEKVYGGGMKGKFVKEHLMKNFYAFELMMAPYAIGHLKMSYVFQDIGINLEDAERFNLYLTNTLEMKDIEQSSLPGMATLSEESRLAGKIKKKTPILVIMGNPPYSGHSSNKGEWISDVIKAYYKVDGKSLGEKNPKWLQDDYVKFIRFSQWKIDQNGEGVLGFITNHGYLDNPTFRGMRQSLMKSFSEMYILDLHGNLNKKEKAPDGSKDENVFDIRQGVAIALLIKKRDHEGPCKVYHAEYFGLRESKYEKLYANDFASIDWKEIHPKSEFYFLVPRDDTLEKKYHKYYKITDIFPISSVGIVTARDKLAIHWTPDEVYRTIEHFSSLTPEDARVIFQLGKDSRDWKVELAQKDIIHSGLKRKKINPILYRPFDTRYTYYTGHSRGFHCMPRPKVMKNLLNQDNLAIITSRLTKGEKFGHAQVADNIVEVICMSPKTSNNGFVFPLYLFQDAAGGSLFEKAGVSTKLPNIDNKISSLLRNQMNQDNIKPETIFFYIYGILYSKIYRDKYEEFLSYDFPRIPFTSDYDLFVRLGELGKKLADIHLMKSPELDETFSKFEGSGDDMVEKITYNKEEQRVYINKNQYFTGITIHIWEFMIGGYMVMEKWLKDRRKRKLSLDEVFHYIRIACALQLTIEYQEKIDHLYPDVEKQLIEFK